MKLRPLFAIVLKDLKLHMGNRRALILTLVVPITVASFFGSLFGGESGKTKPAGIHVQVVDQDKSEISSEIITNLIKDETLSVELTDENTARESVRHGKVAVAVILPPDFGDEASRQFFGNQSKPRLTLLHDPGRSMEANLIKGLLMQHIMESVSRHVFSGDSGRKYAREALDNVQLIPGISEGDTSSLSNLLYSVDNWFARKETNSALRTEGDAGFRMPFEMSEEKTASVADDGPRYNGYAHSFGGMTMQFVLMAAIEWGLGILLERQRGLWRRLRAAPLPRSTLLAGRAISSTIIAMGTLSISWGFSMLAFHVHVYGSWMGFIGVNLALAMFASALGLFISALGRSPEATRGIAIFAILMLVMLGGAWVPAFIFPLWLQKLTLIMPTRWAMDCFDAMTWRGLGFDSAIIPMAVLIGSAIALGAIAIKLFRWEAE